MDQNKYTMKTLIKFMSVHFDHTIMLFNINNYPCNENRKENEIEIVKEK